ncbi:uncharacterized protein LOC132271666 isoform X2 [Cornus florida]|uniref:uncharacterized protein LOC132271666 isoform X2 n=1 Tax=Cornus florida TaxID=4283 RepID=UPI00289FA2DD|nr:uncharacterized protein LOC132271666 isoform X2 [Cornus florida]
MGGHEGWMQRNGFHPNGLLPNEAASVTREIDPDRWLIAEGRTAELIACIQPNQPSEERRNAVLNYVQQLITRSFSCEVFAFGSVPLKTYLPDGDIDLTAFSKNQNLKDTWANEVRDMLESEEKREDAEFRVKEVQYIQAEVKIIKCLVENIVVDISFNQLGGLCTLCFLQEVDSLINQNHLFKRSIILIKAWCYYESRILGAHHGLISTYALETLVLYIFHVFNNSFAGPLEVLYRFLEFFSKFDWDNFCISLWGPVPIRSLPDMTANSPRKDGGELLLSKLFLEACSTVYSGQENHELPFISKHFNVIDPLRTNNNLGRSVSKGNFFRIRSAFAFGAQQLARLLDCPKENIIFEVNQFFMNTWDRHGKGHRPDAPNPFSTNLNRIVDGLGKYSSESSHKREKENSTRHESDVEVIHASHSNRGIFSQNANQSLKRISRTNNANSICLTQSQKIHANLTSSVASDLNRRITQNISSNEIAHTDKGRSARPDNLGNKLHARYQFARTHSSPELTDSSSDFLYRGRRIKASQTTKGQTTSTRLDRSRRINSGAEVSENSALSLAEDLPSSRQSSIHGSADSTADLNSVSNYHGESGIGAMGEDRPSVAEALQMHQDEQDLVNLMGFSRVHNFSGHVQTPVNFASAHLPIPLSPSILASLGYGHRFPAGMVPTIVPSFESPWGPNMHYSQGLVSSPGSQYISTVGISSNHEEIVEPIDNSLEFKESCHENSDHGLWSEQYADSLREFDPDNGSFQVQQLGEKNKVTLTGFPVVPSSQVSISEGCSMKDHASVEENGGLIRECVGENPHYRKIGGSGAYTASSRIVSASLRTKQSSESSSDGSSSKNSKSMAGRWGRKLTPNEDRSTSYKNGWQYENESVDHLSSRTDDDNRDWIRLSTVDTEVAESEATGAVSSLLRSRQMPDTEPAQTSGSNSVLPVAPMFADYGSRQRATENSGMLPFAFYPTGPPVPFVTMLPFYGLPTEPGNSDASTSHFNRDEEFNNPHNGQSDQRLDSTENLVLPDVSSHSNLEGADLAEPSEEHRPDILNSDFTSHWQNLQYGRLCQNPQIHGPTLHPSSVASPIYMQGHIPWGGPGRPVSANANLYSQLMGYGPRIIPVPPLQPGSNRPTSVHQYYGEEIPRSRGGTGTYLPNPISYRERQSSNTRNNRGSYSYDRKDHHGDREGNWINSKQRFVNRGEGHNQFEKPNARIDRSTASNSRSNRPRDSLKPDSFPSNRSQNGPFNSSNSIRHGPPNVAYGMYQLPVGGSHGTAVPSVVMLYPYDQNMGCVSPAEQLEFGSLGPVHFPGINEVAPLGEGSSNGVNENQHYRVDSSYSSPDQPSSPMLQR